MSPVDMAQDRLAGSATRIHCTAKQSAPPSNPSHSATQPGSQRGVVRGRQRWRRCTSACGGGASAQFSTTVGKFTETTVLNSSSEPPYLLPPEPEVPEATT